MTQTEDREPYPELCPKCAGETYLERCGKHIKWSCVKCGYLKFLPQKWQEFTVPFGKYKGVNLSELIESDAEYVRWGAENISSPSVKRAFAAAVEHMDGAK